MREIKFKAQRVDNKEWVEGGFGILGEDTDLEKSVIIVSTLDTNSYIDRFYFTDVEVIPESVGQFTGLKDKNGVEIYEGDIFRYHAHRGYTLPDFTGHVIFENGSFGFIIDSPFNGESMIKYFSDIDELKEDFLDHIEVIGSIHDKHKQKQALIDMMRGDEELGLYDE